jgi:microsomal dipeptidase-like Zn-dependent dipeptidase
VTTPVAFFDGHDDLRLRRTKSPVPREDTWSGATGRGHFDLVRLCDEFGILIDLSHLNETGFDDVTRTSSAPLSPRIRVLTHSAKTGSDAFSGA